MLSLGWQAGMPPSPKRSQLSSPKVGVVESQPTQFSDTKCGSSGSMQSSSTTQPTQAPVPLLAGLSQTKVGPNLVHCDVPSVLQGPQVSVAGSQSGAAARQSVAD